VHFAWQLLEWPIPSDVLAGMGLTLEQEEVGTEGSRAISDSAIGAAQSQLRLVEEPCPQQRGEQGESTTRFRASKRRRRPEEEDRALGLAGELLVVERERHELTAAGHPELADRVVHTAAVEGDGAGFDVASFFPDGRPKYVEVKTTTGPKDADFLISANEVAFAISQADSYQLCRIFDYDPTSNCGRFYSVSGTLFRSFNLTPVQFRVGQLTSK
jgi:hypothetical protein